MDKKMIVCYRDDGKTQTQCCRYNLTDDQASLIMGVLDDLGCDYDLYTTSLMDRG